MYRHVYAFRLDRQGDEVFFRFPKLPSVISAVPKMALQKMSEDEIGDYAHDAVIGALQAHIAMREDVPSADNPKLVAADGFVQLSPREAMKLELFKLYKANCQSVTDFARHIGKKETAARRLLNLRHHSWESEIETAIRSFGKRLVHDWDLEAVPQSPTYSSHL